MILVGLAFLIIVFAALASRLVASASARPPEPLPGGRRVLRVNRGYLLMTALGIALIVLLALLAPARSGRPLEFFPTVAGIALGCVAVGVPVVLATLRVRVEFDEEGIRRIGMGGRATELRWEEVRQVGFNKVRLQLTLAGEKQKIGLNVHMAGFQGFLDLLRQRLEPALWRDALLMLESTKRRL